MAEVQRGTRPVDAEGAVLERSFLIADIRGYTRFTRQRGDAEAARLAQAFAALAEDAVEGRDGRVVEVRGDEVMAVFASPAHAVRAGSSSWPFARRRSRTTCRSSPAWGSRPGLPSQSATVSAAPP